MKKITTVIFAAIIALALAVNTAFAGGLRTPAPPADLIALPGDGQIILSWTASDGAVKYNIYRRNDGYFYTDQTESTTYIDTGLINGTTYCYSVTALNSIDEESLPRGSICAVPAAPGVIITQSDNSTDVVEGGANDTYTIVLNNAPASAVSVSLNPDPQIDFSPRAASFTKTNWNIPQTITVTAVDDLVYEGAHAVVIEHNVFSLDPNYNNISVDDVNVNITDNDVPAGVIISQSGGSTDVAEGGITDTYTVVLNSVPAADVVVSISPDSQVTVSFPTLTFAPERWNVPQIIIVTAVDDSVYEGNHAGVIKHSASSSDPNYNNISISNVAVNITDNDSAPGGGGGGGGAAVLEQPKKQPEEKEETKEETIAFGADKEGFSLEMPFIDLPTEHWAHDFVAALMLEGIVKGTTKNTFEPDRFITRAELTKMAVSAFYKNISGTAGALFIDCEADVWYAPYVKFAYSKNIIAGYEGGLFKPENPVTRAEALKIILKASGIKIGVESKALFSDIDADAWHAPYVNFAAEAEIVAGYYDNTFRPNAFLTRAEAAKIIVKSK